MPFSSPYPVALQRVGHGVDELLRGAEIALVDRPDRVVAEIRGALMLRHVVPDERHCPAAAVVAHRFNYDRPTLGTKAPIYSGASPSRQA